MGSCYWCFLGVVRDVISDAVADEEEAIGWMFPSSGGFLFLGSSIADDVAHDTKKGSIARAREGISTSSSFALAFAFAYLLG